MNKKRFGAFFDFRSVALSSEWSCPCLPLLECPAAAVVLPLPLIFSGNHPCLHLTSPCLPRCRPFVLDGALILVLTPPAFASGQPVFPSGRWAAVTSIPSIPGSPDQLSFPSTPRPGRCQVTGTYRSVRNKDTEQVKPKALLLQLESL